MTFLTILILKWFNWGESYNVKLLLWSYVIAFLNSSFEKVKILNSGFPLSRHKKETSVTTCFCRNSTTIGPNKTINALLES